MPIRCRLTSTSSAERMRTTAQRRSLWLTVPLYAVALAILVLDVWTAAFWARVGGSLGWVLVAIEAGVALLLAVLLVLDARRQWLLRG